LLALNKHVSSLDTFRMNKEKLYGQVNEILSENNIETLKNFNEPAINDQIILTAINILDYLPPGYVKNSSIRLKKISTENPGMTERIDNFLFLHTKRMAREKYKPLVIILATIFICAVIYFASR